MASNIIILDNYENPRELVIHIIIDFLDTLIINISKMLLLIFMFITFIITNAYIRNYYIYI
jgi:hypothetical protein